MPLETNILKLLNRNDAITALFFEDGQSTTMKVLGKF